MEAGVASRDSNEASGPDKSDRTLQDLGVGLHRMIDRRCSRKPTAAVACHSRRFFSIRAGDYLLRCQWVDAAWFDPLQWQLSPDTWGAG